jgi:hypothetical protein
MMRRREESSPQEKGKKTQPRGALKPNFLYEKPKLTRGESNIMAQLTETLTKKRKHAMAIEDSTPSKKSKRDKKDKGKKADKGKSKASSSSGEFKVVNASLVVSIPPVFAGNPRAGVEEMLDSMVMRWVIALSTRSLIIFYW